MGARTWMLVYASADIGEVLGSNPRLDREATQQLAQRLFPKDGLKPLGDGDLTGACPPDGEVHLGCFPGVSIVAAKEFGIDCPSRLPSRFVEGGRTGEVYLHAMHSVVDWFAFARWTNGELVRSLSLSPERGILEDIGPRLPFELPYWSGQHPAGDGEEDEYPFPFHPLELGEAALKAFFNYQLEGVNDPTLLDPESIPLVRYRRSGSWWKFW